MKIIGSICAALAYALVVFQGLLFSPSWHQSIFRISGLSSTLHQQRLELLGHVVRGSSIDQIAWSTAELQHIDDIRGLIVSEQLIVWSLICACASVAYVSLRRADQRSRLENIRRGLVYVGTLIMVVCFVAMILFEPLFRVAHQILFPNGYWEFDPATDIIIQLYPPQFFVYFFSSIGIAIVGAMFTLYFLLRFITPRR